MEHTVTAYEGDLRELSREVEHLGRMAVDQLRAALDVSGALDAPSRAAGDAVRVPTLG